MGRPKGSKNKVKRGPGRPAVATRTSGARRGRPPMAKRGRPAVRRGRPAGSVTRAPRAQLAFNPVDWMPLVMALVDLIKLARQIMAKENGVGADEVTSARTSPSFAKAVAEKAESNAVPVKRRGRPKKESVASVAAPVSASAEVQEEMELEDPLDDNGDDLSEGFEEDPLDDDTLGVEEEETEAVL